MKAIRIQRTMFSIVLATVCISIYADPAPGQFSFVDNFNDGNLEDGIPVTWDGLDDPEGTIEIKDGDLLITPTEATCCVGTFTQSSHRNLTIRMQARLLGEPEDGAFIGTSFRDGRAGDGELYWAGITEKGELAAGYLQDDRTIVGESSVFIC